MKKPSMKKPSLVLISAALVAGLAACAPDVPNAPTGGPTSAIPGAPIDDTVTGAAATAGLPACPTAPSEKPSRDAVTAEVVCLSTGAPASLADFRGTPTIVNVWAHWCTSCREELPLLARAAEEFSGKVQVVGLVFADDDPLAAVRLAQSVGVNYPQLADPDSALAVPLRLRGLPQNIYLDADGRVVGTTYGSFRSYDDLTDALDQQLGVRP